MLEVLVTLAGVALIVGAAFLVYPPLGLATTGALLVYLGAFVDWSTK